MSSPTGVMAIILLESAAGGAAALWASGVWGAVRRGFLLLTGCTVTVLAAGAWALTRAELGAGDRGVVVALGLFAGLSLTWQLATLAGLDRTGRVLGASACVAGVVALVAFAGVRGRAYLPAVAELLLGALFLGSTLFGLLLGHWYLVERRLEKRYMVRSAWLYGAGVAAAAVATWLSAGSPAPEPAGLSPLLGVPSFTLLLAGGFVGICALIAPFVWKLATEGGRSIQAATGYFYLAVIMAFSAEMAAKLRFF